MSRVFLLNDLETGETDAVIIAESSTVDQIQKAIVGAKAEKESEWQWEDVEAALPEDCEIVSRWSDLEIVVY